MNAPLTADVREQRMHQYLTHLQTKHAGQIKEANLTRLNRIANFRRQLMQLLDAFIEARAQELAADSLAKLAPPATKGWLKPAGRPRTRLEYSQESRKRLYAAGKLG